MITVPSPVLVAIVDDSPAVFLGVAALLRPFKHRVRVEQYAGPLPRPGRVDVVLYDPFTCSNALTRLREIAKETEAQVLVYASPVEEAQIDDAMKAGATGFLSKTLDAAAMVTALERVAVDKVVVATPPTPDRLPMAAWPGERHGLSARESAIVSLIVAGMSNQEIASALYLSMKSVKTHIGSAYRRMGVASRTQAVLWGVRQGFELAAPTAHSDSG